MLKQLEELKLKALQELEGIDNPKELDAWRVQYLGKKSPLTAILRGLSTLPIDERKTIGARANQTKTELEENFQQKEQSIREVKLATHAKGETLDISLPGRPLPIGRLHPITQTLNEICNIFISMGFQIMKGPDVEWD